MLQESAACQTSQVGRFRFGGGRLSVVGLTISAESSEAGYPPPQPQGDHGGGWSAETEEEGGDDENP